MSNSGKERAERVEAIELLLILALEKESDAVANGLLQMAKLVAETPMGGSVAGCNWCVGLAKAALELTPSDPAQKLVNGFPPGIVDESYKRVQTYQHDLRRGVRDAKWRAVWCSPLLVGVAIDARDPLDWLSKVGHEAADHWQRYVMLLNRDKAAATAAAGRALALAQQRPRRMTLRKFVFSSKCWSATSSTRQECSSSSDSHGACSTYVHCRYAASRAATMRLGGNILRTFDGCASNEVLHRSANRVVMSIANP